MHDPEQVRAISELTDRYNKLRAATLFRVLQQCNHSSLLSDGPIYLALLAADDTPMRDLAYLGLLSLQVTLATYGHDVDLARSIAEEGRSLLLSPPPSLTRSKSDDNKPST